MADGLGGPPQGFGETIFDATKKVVGQQAQQTGQAIAGQFGFGNQQQGQQATPTSGTFTPPPGGKTPPPPGGMDNFGDFSKLFEKNKLGGKKPAPPQATSNYLTQEQLQQMNSEQEAKDAQVIANLTQELHQMQTKSVMGSGEEALKKQQEYMENLRKEEEEKLARDKEQQAQQNANLAGPGQMQPGQMVDLGPVQNQSSTPITPGQRSGEAKHTE